MPAGGASGYNGTVIFTTARRQINDQCEGGAYKSVGATIRERVAAMRQLRGPNDEDAGGQHHAPPLTALARLDAIIANVAEHLEALHGLRRCAADVEAGSPADVLLGHLIDRTLGR